MFKLLVLVSFLSKALSSHAPASVGHYVQVATVPYASSVPSPPPAYQVYRQTSPTAPPTLAVSVTNPTPTVAHEPPLKPQTPKENPIKLQDKPIDSNVLNNLAIALQLLIVNNILNRPFMETGPEIAKNLALSAIDGRASLLPDLYPDVPSFIETPENYGLEPSLVIEPTRYGMKEPSLPNASFMGSSEPNVFGPYSPKSSSRSSSGLRSPYEAIASFSDPILSYGTYSKKNIKSPYKMIAERDDFYPFSDLF